MELGVASYVWSVEDIYRSLGQRISNGTVMIQILSVTLLWLTSPIADFVCLNGHPTVDAEYRLRTVFIGTVVSERHEAPMKDWDQEYDLRRPSGRTPAWSIAKDTPTLQ